MPANVPSQISQTQPSINIILQKQAKEDAQSRRLELRESSARFCAGIIQSATLRDASNSDTLTEFHVFPKLPAELRAKVCESVKQDTRSRDSRLSLDHTFILDEQMIRIALERKLTMANTRVYRACCYRLSTLYRVSQSPILNRRSDPTNDVILGRYIIRL